MPIKTAYVYWIHKPEHVDMFTEGYVGVSTRPEIRMKSHIREAKNGDHINPKLANAIIKHDESILHTILVVGPEEYCYDLEAKLRPSREIGWNIAEGGDHPPRPRGPKSEEWKQKNRKPKSVQGYNAGEKNGRYGKPGSATGKKWYHDPINMVAKYFVPGEEPTGWVIGHGGLVGRHSKGSK
jgi:hypothetical protein